MAFSSRRLGFFSGLYYNNAGTKAGCRGPRVVDIFSPVVMVEWRANRRLYFSVSSGRSTNVCSSHIVTGIGHPYIRSLDFFLPPEKLGKHEMVQ